MEAFKTCEAGKSGETVSFETALERSRAVCSRALHTQIIAAHSALGRVTAADTQAVSSLPPFNCAAMDGFAFLHGALAELPELKLSITETIAAGDARPRASRSGAVRIFTGAPVPSEFDTIIPMELVHETEHHIAFDKAPRLGKNIRLKGEECIAGTTIIPQGRTLTPARLALAAATGCVEIEVYDRLKVAILSTGNELVEPGVSLQDGQIFNTNRALLRAALTVSWIDFTDLGTLPDDLVAIRTALKTASSDYDVIISTGGMSAGGKDHIFDALIAEGAQIEVNKIAIRPGKPLTVAKLGTCVFFGLPGNPLAAAVTFAQIAVPSLRRLAGIAEAPDNWIPGVAGFSYARTPGRHEFLPVSWAQRDAIGRVIVQRVGNGSSAALKPLTSAMGFAVIEPEVTNIRPGDAIRIEPLEGL